MIYILTTTQLIYSHFEQTSDSLKTSLVGETRPANGGTVSESQKIESLETAVESKIKETEDDKKEETLFEV